MNCIKQIRNRYGKLGEVGTEVFHPRWGHGIVIDENLGTVKWRNERLSRTSLQTIKQISSSFDKFIIPNVSKDMEKLRSYDYDIRSIFLDVK